MVRCGEHRTSADNDVTYLLSTPYRREVNEGRDTDEQQEVFREI
jgi:hypothetical protein